MLGKMFVGFDLETGSAFDDPGRKIITEIGAVKYVLTKTGFKPVQVLSLLVNEGEGVHPDAVEYTGVTTRLIEDFGEDLTSALSKFTEFIADADFLVSHNGDVFDVPVLSDAYDYAKVDSSLFRSKVNIDTMTCVSYPNNCKSRNLTYLQAFYGFVNPFQHRAFADVMAMMKVLELASGGSDGINKVCEVAMSPQVTYVAKFNYPREKDHPGSFDIAMKKFNEVKDNVKNFGFRWQPESKNWVYTGKELIFNKDIKENLLCPVQRIKE